MEPHHLPWSPGPHDAIFAGKNMPFNFLRWIGPALETLTMDGLTVNHEDVETAAERHCDGHARGSSLTRGGQVAWEM